jgi:hypothetical protein
MPPLIEAELLLTSGLLGNTLPDLETGIEEECVSHASPESRNAIKSAHGLQRVEILSVLIFPSNGRFFTWNSGDRKDRNRNSVS